MSKINDGGPVYPIPSTVTPEGYVQPGWYGMTLRDWFAGQALAGMLAKYGIEDSSVETMTEDCYLHADAMLQAREVKP